MTPEHFLEKWCFSVVCHFTASTACLTFVYIHWLSSVFCLLCQCHLYKSKVLFAGEIDVLLLMLCRVWLCDICLHTLMQQRARFLLCTSSMYMPICMASLVSIKYCTVCMCLCCHLSVFICLCCRWTTAGRKVTTRIRLPPRLWFATVSTCTWLFAY